MTAVPDPTAEKIKPRFRWLRWCRFSLRTMFVIMLVSGVGFGWIAAKVRQANKQRQARIALNAKLMDVIFDFQYAEDGSFHWYDEDFPEHHDEWIKTHQPGPAWLRERIGIEYLATVRGAYLYVPMRWSHEESVEDEDARLLLNFPDLEIVQMDASNLTDDGLKPLVQLKRLEKLTLTSANRITNNGLRLLGEIDSLRELCVTRDAITNDTN
ncbi:MAG: hypothetical protein N2C14_01540, partial [Planctomycetales bacterium]